MPIRDTEFGDDFRVGFGKIGIAKSDENIKVAQVIGSTLRMGQPPKNPSSKLNVRRSFNANSVPSLWGEGKRKVAILDNKPAKFSIQENKYAIGGRGVFERPRLGRNAVKKYNNIIEKSSEKHRVDADLVRAVIYAENARGHKGGLNKIFDDLDKSTSRLPMNIQHEKWASLIKRSPEELKEPDANIEASVVLLKRISERIDKPTVEKIGSLWNGLSLEKTNNFGAAVDRVYRERLWEK